MKSATQRRGTTSRKKALSGIPHKLRDGSEQRNKDRNSSKSDHSDRRRQRSSRNSSISKSARSLNERDWQDNYQRGAEFGRRRSRDRFNEYSSGKDQLSPHQILYKNPHDDEYYYEYMQPEQGDGYNDRSDRTTSHNDRRQRGHHRLRQHNGYQQKYHSEYGEHPASRGREEYHGSNKRHSGLLGTNDFYGPDFYDDGYYDDGLYEEDFYDNYDDYYDEREDERKHYPQNRNPNHNRQSNHGKKLYDPIESEYRRQELDNYHENDHEYQHNGAQWSANIEGFGIRGRSQHGQDWRFEDEYRNGHAPRKRGYGRFGSR